MNDLLGFLIILPLVVMLWIVTGYLAYGFIYGVAI